MSSAPDPTVVQPGFVTLDVEWTGAVRSFESGDLAHLTVSVMDTETFNNGIDPETVTILYIPGTGPQKEVQWLHSAWDGSSVQSPAVGVIGRTAQGQFEVWLDTTDATGKWYAQAQTEGAGQGCSPQVQWYVTPILPTIEGGG